MAKDQNGHPVGNTDPDKRGRGGHPPIGQKIPDKVREKIDPDAKGKGGK
jgi:hypothetical protein